MQLRKRYGITSWQRVITSLVVMLTLTGSVVTSQSLQSILSKFNNKRLDVTAQIVTTHSAAECYGTCQLTSGCVSVNLSPDRRTCQLLSEEMTDVTSLQSADGWMHLHGRKTQLPICYCFTLNADTFLWVTSTVYIVAISTCIATVSSTCTCMYMPVHVMYIFGVCIATFQPAAAAVRGKHTSTPASQPSWPGSITRKILALLILYRSVRKHA